MVAYDLEIYWEQFQTYVTTKYIFPFNPSYIRLICTSFEIWLFIRNIFWKIYSVKSIHSTYFLSFNSHIWIRFSCQAPCPSLMLSLVLMLSPSTSLQKPYVLRSVNHMLHDVAFNTAKKLHHETCELLTSTNQQGCL